MNQELYDELVDLAKRVNEKDKKLGFYALRKIELLTAKSPLGSLITCGSDMLRLAKEAGIED